jgi:hypothetical protein
MLKKYAQILVIVVNLFTCLLSFAEESKGCPHAEVQKNSGEKFIFWEREFENGVHDLVISKSDKSDIRRVTYSGKTGSEPSNTCIYKAVAIAAGGDWGWHLAWTYNDKPGVFYSRMDGVAWVSTPVKRIGQDAVDMLSFELNDQQVTLNGHASQNKELTVFKLISEDEGRDW